MNYVNPWSSREYGSFTLTVRYGDLHPFSVAPQDPARTPAPAADVALTFASPPASSDEWALPPRQRQVLELIVQGLPNKEIARRLNLAEGTVKIHVAVLFRKLSVTSRTAAAVAGARMLTELAAIPSAGPARQPQAPTSGLLPHRFASRFSAAA
jgi:DNA-binding CsgD family transcriptional regulator